MVYDLTGTHPLCVVKLNDCEVLIELDPKENVIGEIQKLNSWEGLNVEATYLLLSKRQLMDIVKRQESIESRFKLLR